MGKTLGPDNVEVGKVCDFDTIRFGVVRALVLGLAGDFVEIELRGPMRGASRTYVAGERRGLRWSLIRSVKEVANA